MITNFEEITTELTPEELEAIPVLVKGFLKHSYNSPIKAPVIIREWNKCAWRVKMSETRLRKCVNYIRVNGLCPVIATSRGYYSSQDPVEIGKQITSLEERARSIQSSADGLKKFL